MPDALVRPACELAVVIAGAGLAAVPAVDPPRPLRPFLRFTRLPDAALATVRRVLDADEAFRARVTEASDEDHLGRASWLFLTRPEGWAEELAQLAAVEAELSAAAVLAREERELSHRLARAEDAAARALRAESEAVAAAAKAAQDLAGERRARRAAEEQAERLARRVNEIGDELARAQRRHAEASAEAERMAVAAAAAEAARAAEEERVAAMRAEAERLDAAAVRDALGHAAEAVRAAGDAVAAAAAALPPLPGEPGNAIPKSGHAGAGASAEERAAVRRRIAPTRRRPAALPPGVRDDAPDAVLHLLRMPGTLLLVDGYNVAKAIWPDAGVGELRQRLVDALAELGARTGASVHVVFDGAEMDGASAWPGARAPVRVSFSPPDVEADDVILARLDELPPEQVVVVASSDRRVQEGARDRGANVVSSPQLAGVLGR